MLVLLAAMDCTRRVSEGAAMTEATTARKKNPKSIARRTTVPMGRKKNEMGAAKDL
jgi:hypothetical protein